MPISPELMPLYPGGSIRSPEWLSIVAAIRERAGNRCEGSPLYPECRAAQGQPHPVTASVVILTTAHLDQDPSNNDPGNLRCWCQRCHLAYDRPVHRRKARITRDRRAGQEWLDV